MHTKPIEALLSTKLIWIKALDSAATHRRNLATTRMEAVIRIAIASFAVTLIAILTSAPAHADQYCLQGPDAGYPGDCSFSTYEQCMATASGTYNSCGTNPRYVATRTPSYPRYLRY
jgi:hypothetical protein